MENEMIEFISQGMKRYKEATRLMVLFVEKIQNELQNILIERKKWGNFKPDETKKKRSTTFRQESPYLNADIFGKIKEKQCIVRIAINWYLSETDYPYYIVKLESGADDELLDKFNTYQYEDSNLVVQEQSVKFYPNPENFNLKRDFNLIIDEFVKIISR